MSLPPKEAFKDASRFYATALHEAGHYAEVRIMPHGADWRPHRRGPPAMRSSA
ncbi:MAG: hypothetical protein ACHQAY_20725 [Hyphomicrobiales bacterium]